MAQPLEFPEVNLRLVGEGDTGYLPVHRDQETGVKVSCWELTADELAEISATGKVWLHVWGGHPPVCVSGEDPFEQGAV